MSLLMRLTRQTFWAPEIVQTSAMDCGPAALKCILAGFGVKVSYGRLREACQTSVDGTSIDTLEEVAQLLGLEAAQIMLPSEHAVARGTQNLPAIAVVRMPSGLTHFVVLWRRFGPYLQVMDPARGRRWVRTTTFLRDLYLHTQAIDAEAFRDFAADPAFTTVLAARFAAVGGATASRHLKAAIDAAVADPSWRAMARLDGAARAVEMLVGAGILRRGADAGRALRALLSDQTIDAADEAKELCASHACVHAAPPDADGAARVSLRGAVLVHIAGRAVPSSSPPPLPAELAAALAGDDERPLGRAFQALGGALVRRRALLLLPLLLLAAVAGLGEVVFSRPLLSNGDLEGRTLFVAAATLLVAVVAATLFEWPLVARARALGRALDVGLRRAFFRKLPRLGDRYFASRPISDMAERAHLLHRVRLLPGVAVQLGRTLVELGLATAAIAWLYPGGATVAVVMFVVACAVPLATVPAATERDLRLRTHAGSLLRFYLDVLLGLAAVRTHGAGPALVREHQDRLAEWRRAGRDLVRNAGRIEAVTVLVAVVGAATLVNGYLRTQPVGSAHPSATVFLLLFLALRIPTQATAIVGLWRQVPEHRNVTLRLLEPLGAPEDEPARETANAGEAGTASAAAISFEDVAVEMAGHVVLKELSLHLRPGAHVAVVGPSGAGKSTLVGLLLGFHQPARGTVRVDGVAPRGEALARLRADTVWVDPTIQLWNRTLRENVAFCADSPPTPAALEAALADAELTELAARWPSGVAQTLGEGGGLVSGGEGQRVRFARALARPNPPRVVLLDEPFRGLDREVRRRLLERARARWRDATLIVVTHDLEHTLDFSRVLVVDGGRIVEDDSASALAERPSSLYRRLLDAEARVRRERWAAPFWRRVTVRAGQVEENR